MYEGTPPWEIGRPQPFVEALQAKGEIVGDVLDIGCGTGENALFLTGMNHAVVGVDFAAGAIAPARGKAHTRGIETRFEVGDALELGGLGRAFDTLLDSGVFHVFSDDDRRRYARSLASVSRPGTRLFLACFSEREPDWGGPRRVTRDEIRGTFGRPWAVERIEATRYATLLSDGGAQAWLASIIYVGRPVSQGN